MVTGIQKQYDERAVIVTKMQELAATAAKEGRAFTTEETASFSEMEAEEKALTETIRAYELSEKRAAELAQTNLILAMPQWVSDTTAKKDEGQTRARQAAFENYLRSGITSLTPEERQLVTRGTNTQVVGTDSLGGYLVPDTWQPEIERAMLDYSGIMQAARIIRTAGGQTLYWPTEDDTTTKAVKIAEAAAFTVQDITFSQAQLDAYKYGTLAKVSWELLQDNAYNIEQEVINTFGPRFGRTINEQGTVGDGSGDPNGVVTASTLGKTAASATAFTVSEVIDLHHSLDPAYRRSPSFGFMMHDGVLAYIKKLAVGSSDARPLWQPSFVAGAPDKIDGVKYWINQDMDSSINASSKLILCGDFSKYIIRIVQDMQMIRLNELYAANGLTGFQAWMRFDAELINTAAVKHLITAAS